MTGACMFSTIRIDSVRISTTNLIRLCRPTSSFSFAVQMHAVHLVAYVVHGVYAAHITELHLWRWAPAGVVLVIARDQSEAITGTNALKHARD